MSGVMAPPLAASHASHILNAVKDRLQVLLESSTRVQPGDTVRAALVPSTPFIDASDLANGALNLAWAGKDVLFSGDDPVAIPENGDLDGDDIASTIGIVSAQPFPPAAPVLGGGAITNAAGVLGQLFGTVAPPRLEVGVEVEWVVRDANGNELTEGEDFLALDGLTSPTVSLALPPVIRELRADTLSNPGGEVRCLSARVRLRLGADSLGPFEVGPVPVLVLPLLIPTVVVLFSEPSFDLAHDAAALVIVPEHSPLSSLETLFKTLRKVEVAVDRLRGLGGFAAFLLGLDELLGSVPQQPRLRFVSSNAVERLGDITIKRRPWYQFLGSDPSFDDRVQSLLVFGLPGTKVHFFNDTKFQTTLDGSKQGHFTIEVGNELFVAIRGMHTNDDDPPVTFPPNRVAGNPSMPTPQTWEPDGGGDGLWHTDMSSVRFENDWLAEVESEASRPPVTPALECARRVKEPTRHP